jgi:hypothetical protein
MKCVHCGDYQPGQESLFCCAFPMGPSRCFSQLMYSVPHVLLIAIVIYFCRVLFVLVFIALHMYVTFLSCVNIGIVDCFFVRYRLLLFVF